MSTPGFDGSIRIDTKIETKNFNAGMKKLNSAIAGALGGLAKNFLEIAKVAVVTASTIVMIGAALIKLGQIALNAISKFVDNMYDALSSTNAYRQSLATLKTAFDTLKGSMYGLGATLLNAIAPALLKIIDWLVKAINWLNIFFAALTGQKTAMQYVAGSINSAATGAGKLAKNTKDAEKAAKGALAAFDEINVLQQNQPDNTASTGGGGGGTMQMTEVQVPENFLQDLKQKIKDWFKMVWDRITQGAYDTLQGIKQVFGALGEWFVNNVWTPIVEWATPIWNRIKEIAAAAWSDLTQLWGRLKDVFQERVWEPLKSITQAAWSDIQRLATIAWNIIKAAWNLAKDWFITTVWDPIKNTAVEAWNKVKDIVVNAWNNIKLKWSEAKGWFQSTVIDPIKEGFRVALDWIKNRFTTVFDGIKVVAKNAINGIISFLNRLLVGITSAINGIVRAINSFQVKIPSWVPGIGGTTFGGFSLGEVSAPQIPYLAKGAVIPPNSEFLAVLGDQRSGKNIEAPEQLIRQIVSEELSNAGGQEVTINFAGSLGALVQELKPYIDRENIRVGKSLIRGTI